MERIFISPSRYIQGPAVFAKADKYLRNLGNKALLLVDDSVWQICGLELASQLKAGGIEIIRSQFNGQSSQKEIERLVTEGHQLDVDFVIGLGGGKTLDVSKALGEQLDLPLAILPTVASTDAATSAITVLYSEEGVFERYHYYTKSPDIVLVDTAVIVKAPAFLLVDGIADALATAVEMRAVQRSSGQTLAGGQQTLAAIAIAEKCEAVLLKHAVTAVQANQEKKLTPAFEAVVEANILLGGLGFESGGLAGAHAIHNGFSAIQGPIHQVSHGRKVAYGLLVQLILEDVSEGEFQRYLALYQQLGLPTTLADIKLDQVSYQALIDIGKQATQPTETIHYIGSGITAEKVAQAFTEVNRLGTSSKKR